MNIYLKVNTCIMSRLENELIMSECSLNSKKAEMNFSGRSGPKT